MNLPIDNKFPSPVEGEKLKEIGLVEAQSVELEGKIMAVGPSYSKLVSNRSASRRESPKKNKFVPY